MKPTRLSLWILAFIISIWIVRAAEYKYTAAEERRNEFLQRNFSRFIPVAFQKGPGSMAAVRRLNTRTNSFDYEGEHYCGFKFEVPKWIDGDFAWTFLFSRSVTNADGSRPRVTWFIVPETGRMDGFTSFQRGGFSNVRELKGQFPWVDIITTQDLTKDRLVPGKTCAIWFSFAHTNVSELAFAMTINSEHGTNEFGWVPSLRIGYE